MKGNIILIGFMGTGKTVVGRKLASKLNKRFIDTDAEIERVTGIPVSQLIKKHGEIRFKSEENLAIKRLMDVKNSVIATGGGIIFDDENMKLLKNIGKIITLTASTEVIKERIERRNNRPLLGKDKSIEKIKELIEKREKYYKEADYQVDTTELSVDNVIDDILRYIKESEINTK
jgi:shikimate kinase